MKRRKWWLIGLALALLAACVGVWNWSERPPYKFMQGGKLWFVSNVGAPGLGWVSEVYALDEPLAVVRERARIEVGAPASVELNHWDAPSPDAPSFQIRHVDRIREQTDLGLWDCPPIPSRAKTFIVLNSQRPSTLTRVRAWLYGLRWKGPKGP